MIPFIFQRFVALLLVPSLLVDPLTAAALSNESPRPVDLAAARGVNFLNQALMERLTGAEFHPAASPKHISVVKDLIQRLREAAKGKVQGGSSTDHPSSGKVGHGDTAGSVNGNGMSRRDLLKQSALALMVQNLPAAAQAALEAVPMKRRTAFIQFLSAFQQTLEALPREVRDYHQDPDLQMGAGKFGELADAIRSLRAQGASSGFSSGALGDLQDIFKFLQGSVRQQVASPEWQTRFAPETLRMLQLAASSPNDFELEYRVGLSCRWLESNGIQVSREAALQSARDAVVTGQEPLGDYLQKWLTPLVSERVAPTVAQEAQQLARLGANPIQTADAFAVEFIREFQKHPGNAFWPNPDKFQKYVHGQARLKALDAFRSSVSELGTTLAKAGVRIDGGFVSAYSNDDWGFNKWMKDPAAYIQEIRRITWTSHVRGMMLQRLEEKRSRYNHVAYQRLRDSIFDIQDEGLDLDADPDTLFHQLESAMDAEGINRLPAIPANRVPPPMSQVKAPGGVPADLDSLVKDIAERATATDVEVRVFMDAKGAVRFFDIRPLDPNVRGLLRTLRGADLPFLKKRNGRPGWRYGMRISKGTPASKIKSRLLSGLDSGLWLDFYTAPQHDGSRLLPAQEPQASEPLLAPRMSIFSGPEWFERWGAPLESVMVGALASGIPALLLLLVGVDSSAPTVLNEAVLLPAMALLILTLGQWLAVDLYSGRHPLDRREAWDRLIRNGTWLRTPPQKVHGWATRIALGAGAAALLLQATPVLPLSLASYLAVVAGTYTLTHLAVHFHHNLTHDSDLRMSLRPAVRPPLNIPIMESLRERWKSILIAALSPLPFYLIPRIIQRLMKWPFPSDLEFMITLLFGFAIGMAGMIIYETAAHTLKSQRGAGTEPSGPLVTQGLYQWVRHPIYMGYFLAYGGILSMFSSLITTVPLFVVLPSVVYYCVDKAGAEETHLHARFGDLYRDYARRTPSFFPFRLPRLRLMSATAPAVDGQHETQDPDSEIAVEEKPLVIMAEDDRLRRPRIFDEITKFLGDAYAYRVCNDGLEAWKVIEDAIASGRPIALLVTDISMPGISGSELTARLLALHPYVPIIIHTTEAMDDLRQAFMDPRVRIVAKENYAGLRSDIAELLKLPPNAAVGSADSAPMPQDDPSPAKKTTEPAAGTPATPEPSSTEPQAWLSSFHDQTEVWVFFLIGASLLAAQGHIFPVTADSETMPVGLPVFLGLGPPYNFIVGAFDRALRRIFPPLFSGPAEAFTNLTPEWFRASYSAWLQTKRGRALTTEEETEIDRFARLLAPPLNPIRAEKPTWKDEWNSAYRYIFLGQPLDLKSKRAPAENATSLGELNDALKIIDGYPRLCLTAAPLAFKILQARGFSVRRVRRTRFEGIVEHEYVEVEVAGQWLIVDLVASQFGILQTWGVVAIPKEIATSEPAVQIYTYGEAVVKEQALLPSNPETPGVSDSRDLIGLDAVRFVLSNQMGRRLPETTIQELTSYIEDFLRAHQLEWLLDRASITETRQGVRDSTSELHAGHQNQNSLDWVEPALAARGASRDTIYQLRYTLPGRSPRNTHAVYEAVSALLLTLVPDDVPVYRWIEPAHAGLPGGDSMRSYWAVATAQNNKDFAHSGRILLKSYFGRLRQTGVLVDDTGVDFPAISLIHDRRNGLVSHEVVTPQLVQPGPTASTLSSAFSILAVWLPILIGASLLAVQMASGQFFPGAAQPEALQAGGAAMGLGWLFLRLMDLVSAPEGRHVDPSPSRTAKTQAADLGIVFKPHLLEQLRYALQGPRIEVLKRLLEWAEGSELRGLYLRTTLMQLVEDNPSFGDRFHQKTLALFRELRSTPTRSTVQYLASLFTKDSTAGVWLKNNRIFLWDATHTFEGRINVRYSLSSGQRQALVGDLLVPESGSTFLLESVREVLNDNRIGDDDLNYPLQVTMIQEGLRQKVYAVFVELKDGRMAPFVISVPQSVKQNNMVRKEFEYLRLHIGDPHALSVLRLGSVKLGGTKFYVYSSLFLDRYSEVVYHHRRAGLFQSSPGAFLATSSQPPQTVRLTPYDAARVLSKIVAVLVHFYDPEKRTMLGGVDVPAGDFNFPDSAFLDFEPRTATVIDTDQPVKLIAWRSIAHGVDPAAFIDYVLSLRYLNSNPRLIDFDSNLKIGVLAGLRSGLIARYGYEEGQRILTRWFQAYADAVDQDRFIENGFFQLDALHGFLEQLTAPNSGKAGPRPEPAVRSSRAGKLIGILLIAGAAAAARHAVPGIIDIGAGSDLIGRIAGTDLFAGSAVTQAGGLGVALGLLMAYGLGALSRRLAKNHPARQRALGRAA